MLCYDLFLNCYLAGKELVSLRVNDEKIYNKLIYLPASKGGLTLFEGHFVELLQDSAAFYFFVHWY